MNKLKKRDGTTAKKNKVENMEKEIIIDRNPKESREIGEDD
jgi:hypothetical protein